MPESYHFFREFGSGTFDVNFEDLFSLYNFQRLDSNLMRVWTLFEALEAKRLQASIGFIDPLILNDVQLR